MNALDLTRNTVNIAETGWCALYKATKAEYDEHWIVYITSIAGEIRSIRFLAPKIKKFMLSALDLTRNTVNIAETGWCALYKATNAEYNEHRIVYITSIAGEIRSIRILAPKIKKFMTNALNFTGNTVNIAETGWCALYKATNAEYNEHRIVYINSTAGEIRSIRFVAPKIKKFMMNALDLTRNTVNIAETGWCALYNATNAEYNEHRIVYITSIAGEIRSIRFLAPKIKKFMMNALDLTRNTINMAQTGWCALYKATNAEYNEHRIVYINPLPAEIRSVRFLAPKIKKFMMIALDLTGNAVNIAQTGWCALYKGTNAEYNEHRIVYITRIAGEIRPIRFFPRKLKNSWWMHWIWPGTRLT
jgi:hypothetical protein